MRRENSFEVSAAPERAWDLLMDVPRVVPCMPETELTETVDDPTWEARMRVELGPMSFAFATDVKREDVDEMARRARLSARAREERGRGGGQATIESTLVPVYRGTRVQLVDRFAECLKAEPSQSEDAAPARETPPPRPAEAVSGLSLIVGELRRALARIFRRREP